MRILVGIGMALVCALAMLFQVGAQAPGKKADRDEPAKKKAKDYSDSPLVKRMMAFDKNRDGKLTKDEVTDRRLHRLFDQADTNKDGVVTKEELMALAAKLDAEGGDEPERGGPGDRGPGGPGRDGPGGRGPGRFGPPPPRPGVILGPPAVERLNLTAEQRKQLAALQKEVDAKLAKILTEEQKKELEKMREGPPPPRRGGPGGRGPRPGGRRPGDGPPPFPPD
jgi:hypothetical protein